MSDNYEIPQLDSETKEMVNQFVSEALDSLDSNEPIVENLRYDNNSEFVNSTFRVFHTLKGLSGFFEMYVINRVTHEAETLLDIIRKQNNKQTEDTISIIYSTFDFLRELLNRISVEYTDRSGEAEAEDMILILKDAIEKVKNPISEDDFFDEPSIPQHVPSKLVQVPQAPVPVKQEVYEESEDSDGGVGNDMLDQYLTSALELIDNAENNLLILEKDPDNFEMIGETFGAIHSLKGNSGFMGLAEIEEIAVEMETILDCFRNKELDVDANIITILLSNIETIRDRLGKISKKETVTKPIEVKVEQPEFLKQTTKTLEKEVVKEIPKSSVKTPEDSFEEVEDEEREVDHQSIPAGGAAEAIAKATAKKEPGEEPKRPAQSTSVQKKDIRVETIKIDKLFDLVGELITIETMVTNSPDLQGLSLPNFHKSANMLNKITRELQEITMSVRMMTLEGMFNKMKRLVRDVSLKMEKKINFEVVGQETEMDKNVIDEIADPLVHILRNAIDHGVEAPKIRKEKGKTEFGTISLKARYEGNEILIIVKDDGAGINREKVLKKAEEKGLLTVPADKMTDKEVFHLVFEPGFSTADKLTDISGRGVGMDVVKKNLEKLHGSVDVTSVPEKGSTFTLRIPLTLAIMEAMVIRVGESRYALPLLAVNESFRTQPGMITKTMDGLEVVKIRDEVLPVIRLHELFSKQPDSKDLDKGILILIESREKQVALFADEIVGQQQAVIKALSDYIGKVPGITGCMILGDGGIGLILDIESLIEMSEIDLVNV